MTRRRRSLSSEERRLWAHVARGVAPLKGRPASDLEPEPESAARAETASLRPAPLPLATPKAAAPALPPLAPIERKTLTGLRRGTRVVDARIDLHGMRQHEAHQALLGFLRRAQGSGHGLVLVITGKGGLSLRAEEERGVLRRMVPHWLRLPDLRSIVLGFEEAASHHGGAGALYVRLRRRRGGGEP